MNGALMSTHQAVPDQHLACRVLCGCENNVYTPVYHLKILNHDSSKVIALRKDYTIL